MVKTPFIVGGAAIVVVVAATAYLTLRPAPVVAPTTPVAAPQTTVSVPQPTPTAVPSPQSDCLLPGPPPVPPDGGKATAEDMKLAHDVIQSFVVQLEFYQSCREKQIAVAGTTATSQQKLAWRDQGNAAVDEAQALAGAFSSQLKIYHTKHPEPIAPALPK